MVMIFVVKHLFMRRPLTPTGPKLVLRHGLSLLQLSVKVSCFSDIRPSTLAVLFSRWLYALSWATDCDHDTIYAETGGMIGFWLVGCFGLWSSNTVRLGSSPFHFYAVQSFNMNARIGSGRARDELGNERALPCMAQSPDGHCLSRLA
jgi:hypothetical protein